MKKKLLSLIISILLVVSLPAAVFAAEPLPIKIYSDAAVIYDLNSGECLYEYNADELRYPASTTKMMTAILALELLDPEQILTVDAASAGIGGNSLNLKSGEQFKALDLIWGTLVISANDGAAVIAKSIAGSYEDFAKLMNAKAEELGCTGTHFVNPHGLHDDNHYTTARDLAIIAQYCLKNETFRAIVSTPEYTVHPVKGNERTVENTNWLLNDTKDNHRVYVGNDYRYCKYEGCIGVKTGQTLKAGSCLVTAAERGDTAILAVVLHAGDTFKRFSDGIALLDLGFESIRTIIPMKGGTELGTVAVKMGSVKSVNVELEKDIKASISTQSPESIISTRVDLEPEITAPVAKGQILGKVSVYKEDVLIGEYNAVATDEVPEGGPLARFGIDDAGAAKIFKVIKTIVLVIVILFLCFVAVVLYLRKKERERRARRAAKMKSKRQEKDNVRY